MKSEWTELPLGKIIDLVIDYRGKTPKKLGGDWSNTGYRALSAKNIKTGRIVQTDTIRYVDESLYQKWMKDEVRRGDILITSEAPFGQIFYWDSDEKIVLSQRLFCIRVNPKYDARFIYYYMTTSAFQGELAGRSTGTTVIGLRQPELMKCIIHIPSGENQHRIASILASIDAKISSNQKINDNLYEMVNAYYTSLFKDVECEMTTIGNYAERIYSGGTPTTSNAAYWDGAFGWFSSGETRNRFVISTEKTITQAGIDNSSTKLAAKHDIVMASAGQGFTRGQTSMLLIDTYVNQSVIVIHAERKVLPYLFWNLANRYEELRAISDSSSIRGSLTTKMIAAFEIPLANEESLQAFSDFSWSVIPKIENNLLENERLAALRDNLLPKLMSGEIDVSNIQL